MNKPKTKPGSIASEAARLTVELGRLVTPDAVRWWRKKRYDLHDIEKLRHHLKQQERISIKLPPQAAAVPDDEPETIACRLITDETVSRSSGVIPATEILEYLRDRWEALEWHAPQRLAHKSPLEIAEIVANDIEFEFRTLNIVLPSLNLTVPEWLAEKPLYSPPPCDPGSLPTKAQP